MVFFCDVLDVLDVSDVLDVLGVLDVLDVLVVLDVLDVFNVFGVFRIFNVFSVFCVFHVALSPGQSLYNIALDLEEKGTLRRPVIFNYCHCFEMIFIVCHEVAKHPVLDQPSV